MAAALIPNLGPGSDGSPPVLSAVERVSSLPLVSSTYGLVSTVYSSTKDTHPYIRTVCEAAEQGVRSITSAVFTTASPIIDKLEPQRTSPSSGHTETWTTQPFAVLLKTSVLLVARSRHGQRPGL